MAGHPSPLPASGHGDEPDRPDDRPSAGGRAGGPRVRRPAGRRGGRFGSAVRRTRQPLGAVVVVQGAGPIGLLAAQHARHAGAGRLVVIEPNAERRHAATELGFTEVFEPGDAVREHLLVITGGVDHDLGRGRR